MKKAVVFTLAVLPFFGLAAQSKGAMSLNGVTGLYVVPTAHVGREDSALGFNAGYHVNFPGGGVRNNHLFQFNLSMFRWIEIAGTYDGQPRANDDDVLLGVKFKLDSILPVKTNFALGANIHYNDIAFSGRHWTFQFYGVVSYSAEFFSWPAETTLAAGKSFFEGQSPDSGIDFGMGFDLILLPKHLKNFVHWIIDFSNFNYSASGWGLDTGRGILNTGIRIDLGQIPALSGFNFVIDAYLADAFDDSGHGMGRTFGLGLTFGVKL